MTVICVSTCTYMRVIYAHQVLVYDSRISSYMCTSVHVYDVHYVYVYDYHIWVYKNTHMSAYDDSYMSQNVLVYEAHIWLSSIIIWLTDIWPYDWFCARIWLARIWFTARIWWSYMSIDIWRSYMIRFGDGMMLLICFVILLFNINRSFISDSTRSSCISYYTYVCCNRVYLNIKNHTY